MAGRVQMAGWVEPATRDRWNAYAARHGVSVSTLLEAMGELLPENGDREAPWLRQVLRVASALRDERSDRRPRS